MHDVALHPGNQSPHRGGTKQLAAMAAMIWMSLALSGCESYALDREMAELCNKDGGKQIYETVTLTPAEYEAINKYVMTAKSREEYFGPDYRVVDNREYIKGKDNDPAKGRGRLLRSHAAIYRRSDDRLLGEQVQYIRSGGDGFTFGLHHSSNVCPRFDRDVDKLVFVKGE
jgi:hypothetical protein